MQSKPPRVPSLAISIPSSVIVPGIHYQAVYAHFQLFWQAAYDVVIDDSAGKDKQAIAYWKLTVAAITRLLLMHGVIWCADGTNVSQT